MGKFGGGVDEREADGDEGVDAAADYGADEELVKHSLSFRFIFDALGQRYKAV